MEIHEPGEISSARTLVSDPLVSVLMITYNHAEYLADAVEGVLNQCCDFPFELVIGEDASTDDTLEIALQYQRRYPGIIRLVHSSKNIGAAANSRRIFDRARGKYIAYCEGDDFWCACDKLARQVALIESDPGVGIVHTDWTKTRFAGGRWQFDLRKSVHRRVPGRYLEGDLLATWYFPKILRTCTVLMRRELMQACYDSGLPKDEYPFGDCIRSVFAVSRSRVAYLAEVASVYRVSPNSALRSGAKSRVNFYRHALRFDTHACAFFQQKAHYNPGYRWEAAASLLVWAMRAHDRHAVQDAVRDFRAHFSPWKFLVMGWQSIALRIPSVRRQARDIPDAARLTRPAQ